MPPALSEELKAVETAVQATPGNSIAEVSGDVMQRWGLLVVSPEYQPAYVKALHIRHYDDASLLFGHFGFKERLTPPLAKEMEEIIAAVERSPKKSMSYAPDEIVDRWKKLASDLVYQRAESGAAEAGLAMLHEAQRRELVPPALDFRILQI